MKTCQCCGGRIPPEASEAYQDEDAGECPGHLAVDATGQVEGCGAFSAALSWEEEDDAGIDSDSVGYNELQAEVDDALAGEDEDWLDREDMGH